MLFALPLLAAASVAIADDGHSRSASHPARGSSDWGLWQGTWVSGTEIVPTTEHDAFVAAMADEADCPVERMAELYDAFRPRVLHSLMIEDDQLSLAYPDGRVCTARYSIAPVGEVTAAHTATIYGAAIQIDGSDAPEACKGLASLVFTAPHQDGLRGWGMRVSADALDELVTQAGGPSDWRPVGMQAFVPMATDAAMVSGMLSSPMAVRANTDLLQGQCRKGG
ncbi:MAG: hypothetical protein AAF449_04395 [Myxococcota bacterium]